jgi:hypothetical protein
MENAQKDKVYGYFFTVVLSLISLFCLYNVVSILLLSPYSGKKLQSRISSTVNAIEHNIKRAGLESTEKVINKSNLINKVNGSSWAKKIERTSIFAGRIDVNRETAEEEFVIYEQIELPVSTEIIFKGLVDDLAYISIRMEIEGKWREHGFPTKIGERIGGEKISGGKTLDFTTNYVLQDIVYKAKRPTTLMKKVVILNDAGEFVGTRLIPGETFMKTTSKIKYKDEYGNINELWLKESARTTKVEEEDLSENVEKKAKPAVSSESTAIENLTKQQQEAIDKAKKPFEKNVELLRSIIEEAESGY